jgi:hypothetical protein
MSKSFYFQNKRFCLREAISTTVKETLGQTTGAYSLMLFRNAPSCFPFTHNTPTAYIFTSLLPKLCSPGPLILQFAHSAASLLQSRLMSNHSAPG